MLVDSLYYQNGFLWDSVVGKKGSGDDGSLSCEPLSGYMLTCQHPNVASFSSDVPVVPNPLEQMSVQSPWGTTIRPWIRAPTEIALSGGIFDDGVAKIRTGALSPKRHRWCFTVGGTTVLRTTVTMQAFQFIINITMNHYCILSIFQRADDGGSVCFMFCPLYFHSCMSMITSRFKA